jgi:hypothetical protein
VCGHLELREYSRVSHARGGGVSCREAGGNSRERLNDGVEQEQDMSPSIGLRNLIRFSPPAASGRGASATPAWRALLALAFVFSFATGACAQSNSEYNPEPGEAGKDVVWVPTDSPLVEKMLDIAKVTPDDYLIDLGAGDGRTVIAAAKRGLTAHGIEYNPKMVDLAKKRAAAAGVADRATFEKADIFESDFSKASVITMFLLEDINIKLRPKILGFKPGTRVVSNTFTMGDWQADETATLKDCVSWCTALLWIVPARVQGTWRLGEQDLQLRQEFQMLTGQLGSSTIIDARMKGNQISFTTGGQKYVGTVNRNRMSGTIVGSGTNWSAQK